eukprot:COSAG04_NODE_1801_length_5550_cov_4.388369_2_plen_392_part_00
MAVLLAVRVVALSQGFETAVAGRPAAAPGLPERRGATVGWPEARAWQQPRALSAEECARVRSLTGVATEGLVSSNPGAEPPLTRGRPWPGGSHVGGAPPAELRSTKLQWLAPSAQTAWLYDRLLAVAREANDQANWQYERLDALQNLQLGLYDASASTPGHYDWHVDQEWAPAAQRLPPAKVRILSLSVQISEDEAYSGADLQIGLVNATREQGSVLVFPSFQLHKVYPATRGQRYSLVGWVMGSDPRRYWTHSIAIHEYLLGKAHQGAEVMAATGYAGAGRGRFSDQMVYASLQTLNNAMVLQQNWSQVMSLSGNRTAPCFSCRAPGLRPGARSGAAHAADRLIARRGPCCRSSWTRPRTFRMLAAPCFSVSLISPLREQALGSMSKPSD